MRVLTHLNGPVRRFAAAILLAASLPCTAQNTAVPYPSPVRDTAGVVCSEFVYDRTAFPSCHASTIAENREGTLVAALFGGTHENNADCSIYITRRESEGWTTPEMVAGGVVDGVKTACWNPVLFQIPEGDLLLFYKVGVNVQEWTGWLIRSHDGGRTWSEPQMLPDGYLGPAKNKPVMVGDEIYCGTSLERGGWRSYIEVTDREVKEWRKIGPLSNRRGLAQFIQPAFFVRDDGSLQILGRSIDLRGNIQTVFSDSSINVWSIPLSTGLPNNDSGLDGMTLSDGRFLLVYNHIEAVKHGAAARSPLNVALSENGFDWYAALTLEDSAGDEYSYPSAIETSDGLVHIVYTWHRECIKHVVLDPSRLAIIPERRIVDEQWPDEGASPAAAPVFDTSDALNAFAGGWRPHDRGTHDLYGNLTGTPFRMEYAAQGLHSNGKSTLYPSPLALAATFDTLLVRRVGQSIAADARARGTDAALMGDLTLYDGDNEDFLTFSDNPGHAASCATAFARGLKDGGVAAIARYRAAEKSGQQRALLGQALRSGEFAGLMVRGAADGIPATEDRETNIDFIRGECGFSGLILGDIDEVHNALAAFRGGTDTDVPRGRHLCADTLQRLIDEGVLTSEEVEARRGRIVSALAEQGLDNPRAADLSIPMNREESRALSLEAARKSLVLLKNRGRLLPLKERDKNILVLGNRVNRNSESRGLASVYPYRRTTFEDAIARDHRFENAGSFLEVVDLAQTGEFFADPSYVQAGLEVVYTSSGGERRDCTRAVDEAWGAHTPVASDDGSFRAHWSGCYVPEHEQIVRFALSGRGYFRLLVDGREACSDANLNSADESVYMFRAKEGEQYSIDIYFESAEDNPEIQFTYARAYTFDLDAKMRRADKIVICTGSDGQYDGEMRFWADIASKYRNKSIIVIQCCDSRAAELAERAGAAVMAWHAGEDAGQAVYDILTGRERPSGRMPVSTDRYPFGYGLGYK